MDHRGRKYVVVHNRHRDGYQIAAALAEAGLLAALVTDFYAPALLARLGGPFARRRHPAVPSGLVRPVWRALALQIAGAALSIAPRRVFARVDPLLARRAARVARQLGADLLCYGSYVPAPADRAGLRVIDFEYHPDAQATLGILAADRQRFPETAWSFALEQADGERASHDRGWARADAVLCASAMTRRSLEIAGCDLARITVIPYGTPPPAGPPAPRAAGECRFLFVGQGIQRKGLHHLIRAWQARPRPDASLTLVCYRIDPGIAELIAPGSGIALLDRQSPEQLAALYATTDVFAMPSLVEGFGLVYCEALGHGCHVLATANTGLPDLGLSAAAVTLVEPGDLVAIDRALDRLIAAKAAGSFDPVAIAAEGTRRRWSDFRADIAAFAAAFGDRERGNA